MMNVWDKKITCKRCNVKMRYIYTGICLEANKHSSVGLFTVFRCPKCASAELFLFSDMGDPDIEQDDSVTITM